MQKRKRGNLRGGRKAPLRRLLHPLRFCFRFRFNLRLIFVQFHPNGRLAEPYNSLDL